MEVVGLSSRAQTIAVVMNDLDIPFIREYCNWLVWNISAQSYIPENIPHDVAVQSLGGAVQGIGYGKHGYRGPKPPAFNRRPHRYQYHVYVLDCRIQLDCDAKRKAFLQAIKGHVIQHGSITGLYQNKIL